MDLRMNKVEQIYKVLKTLELEEDYAFFYDREIGEVVSIEADLLDDTDTNYVDDEEASLLTDILTDIEDRFLRIEPLDETDYFEIESKFVRESNKVAFQDEYEKILDSKKYEEKFMALLDKFELEEEYSDFEDIQFVKIAEQFLMDNHIIVRNANIKNLRRAYETADEFATLHLWDYFADTDVIEVRVDDQYSLYYSIMGNAGKTYGLSIFTGESGLNTLSLIASASQYGIDDLLAMSFEKCLTIYFDKEEDAMEDDIAKANEIAYKHVSDYVTSINTFEPGYFFSSDIDDRHCIFVTNALEMLMAGLSSPLPDDFDPAEQTLRINIKEDEVSAEVVDKIILSYTPEYELENKRDEEVNVIEGTYELNLSVLNEPQMKDDNVTPLWVYSMVLIDRDNNKILNIFERTNESGNVIELLQFDLMQFFNDNDIANDIYVNNPMVEAIMEPYSDVCAITIDEPSEIMEALVDQINEIASEKEEVN